MVPVRLALTPGAVSCTHEQEQHNGLPAVVASGANHSMLISRRGELFTWGLCSSGELGHRDTPIDVNIPWQARPSCSCQCSSGHAPLFC